MGKVFEWIGNKGSLISSEGLIGTIGNGAEFARTVKGLGMRFNRDDYISYTHSFSETKIAYEIWFTPKKSVDSIPHLVCGNNYSNRVIYLSSTGAIAFYATGASGSGLTGTLFVNFDQPNHLYLYAEDNGAGYDLTIVLNGVSWTGNEPAYNLSSFTSVLLGRWDVANYGMIGDIHKAVIFDEELTQKEIVKSYQTFLNATPIQRAVEDNLDYPALKPKDLSNEPGLVAAYNMQPSPDATLVDISGNGNNGTIVGAVSSKDGLRFAKAKDQIDLGFQSAFGIGDFTIATRVFLVGELAGEYSILSNRSSATSGYQLKYNSDEIIFSVGTVSIRSGLDESYVKNQWCNIVAIRDGGIGSLYLNGVLLDQGDASDNITNAVNDLIGNRTGADHHWEGDIADLKIFNYAFSEQEAQEYHSQFAKEVKFKDVLAKDYGVGDTI